VKTSDSWDCPSLGLSKLTRQGGPTTTKRLVQQSAKQAPHPVIREA